MIFMIFIDFYDFYSQLGLKKLAKILPNEPKFLPKSVYSVHIMYLAAQNAGNGPLYRKKPDFYSPDS